MINKQCSKIAHRLLMYKRIKYNTQIDNMKDLVIMLTYDKIQYNDDYSKTSQSLYQFYRYGPKNPITDLNNLNSNQDFKIIPIMKVL